VTMRGTTMERTEEQIRDRIAAHAYDAVVA
jgi:hypothetical protein